MGLILCNNLIQFDLGNYHNWCKLIRPSTEKIIKNYSVNKLKLDLDVREGFFKNTASNQKNIEDFISF